MRIVYLTLFYTLICSSLFAQLSSSDAKRNLNVLLSKSEISTADFQQVEITDQYISKGIEHIYFRQSIDDIPLFQSQVSIHGTEKQFILTTGKTFSDLAKISRSSSKRLNPSQAISSVCKLMNYPSPQNLVTEKSDEGRQMWTFIDNKVSEDPMKVQLFYFAKKDNELSLVYAVEINDKNSADHINFIIDANSGEILEKHNYTVYCSHGHAHNHRTVKHCENHESTKSSSAVANSYVVYKWPIEAPHNGARTTEVTPWNDNVTASPNGWHTFGGTNYTSTRGNNTDAYDDSDNTNSPTNGDDARADGGATLDFNFPLDVTQPPANYKKAAITNLFYWSNVTHDVWYNYGFDEPSGNFQEENFGRGGAESDYVYSEAQDGSGTCNANMSTPPDGGNPRIQMYLCNGRDGDFDNGVIVHEYGHGISIRLTGGPSTSSCLSGAEQMGEGWSDYFGMVMTIEPGDAATDSRGMGTWLFGEGPDGDGIRPHPYSTDMAVNPFTYDAIKGNVSVPHGVGSVWATMLWEMTWALIEEHGWDPDIYNGTGGNNIAMQLVIEGLKLQPCNPGFVDGRDAILQADQLLYNGENSCIIWEAFAKRGLGYSAQQGSSSSRLDGAEAFDLPPSCRLNVVKTASVNNAFPGDPINFEIKVRNNSREDLTSLMLVDTLADDLNFVSATSGGSYDNVKVAWPMFNLDSGDSLSFQVNVTLDAAANAEPLDFMDDVENGSSLWETSNTGAASFSIVTTDANSGTSSWFASNVSSTSIANLQLDSPIGVSASTTLAFTHKYNTQENADGGAVFVSTDGENWQALNHEFTSNGPNSNLVGNVQGFSGNSNGFITSVVDLSAFAGNLVYVRFQMLSNASVGGTGWWIDDIIINNLEAYVNNTANVANNLKSAKGSLVQPIKINVDPSGFVVDLVPTGETCFEAMDGSIAANVSNGSGSFTYLWSNGETTSTISNLTSDFYSVSVSDGTVTKTKSVFLVSPNALTTRMSSTDSPGSFPGSATVEVQGGTEPYAYLWNTGATTPTIDNIQEGMYYVTVTDANQCVKLDSVEVVNPLDCNLNGVIIRIQLDQYAGDNALIVKDATETVILEEVYGSANNGQLETSYLCIEDGCYTIEISDSYGDGICASYANPQGYYEILDMETGDLIYTGCAIGNGVELNLCYPLMSVEVNKSDPSCINANDGSISVLAADGSGNFTYSFSTGATTSSINNLAPGDYSLTVTDGITSKEETVTIYSSVATVYTDGNEGQGSLRFAIDSSCPTDTVSFEIDLMGDTIMLTQAIDISGNVVLEGLGTEQLNISGSGLSTLFTVSGAGDELHLKNVKLQNGASNIIFNEGTLKLENVIIEMNSSGGEPISGTGDITIEGVVEIKE